MRREPGKSVLIETKIQIPRVKKHILHRSRLVKQIKENLDKKLILINAGAGYGKTTLAAQFLAKVDIPAAFYHLEKTDGELSVFMTYLMECVRKSIPGFGGRTKAILTSVKNPSQYFEMITGTFINELIEHVKGEFIIVFDDHHLINDSRDVNRTLDYLLRHIPSNVHLMILTRETPNIIIPFLKAKHEMFELSTEDLKFSGTEIMKFYQTTRKIPLDDRETAAIQEQSEGWVTALQLLSYTYQKDAEKMKMMPGELFEARHYPTWQQDYFNYFAQEIFDRESSEIQNFLIACTIPEVLDSKLCNALTKKRNTAVILADLEKRNVFLSHIAEDSYRFHHLFRDFLLTKHVDTQHKKSLYLKAAQHFRKQEKYEDAFRYYVEAGNFSQARTMIKNIGYHLVDAGKSATLCSYIDNLPGEMVSTSPELLAMYGYALLFQGHPDAAAVNLQKAATIFKRSKRAASKLAETYYQLGSISFTVGDYKKARDWLLKAMDSHPQKNDLNLAGIYNSLGLLYSRTGYTRYRDAVDCFRTASRIVQRFPGSEALEASIMNNWAMVERKSGNIRTAHERLLSAIELLGSEQIFSPQSGVIFANAARHCLYLGMIDRANQILKSAIEKSTAHNDMFSLTALWRGCALYYEETGDLDAAKEYIQKSLTTVQELRITRMMPAIYHDLCRINAGLGMYAEAEENIRIVKKDQGEKDSPARMMTLMTEAQLLTAQNHPGKAEEHLQHALSLSKKYRQPLEIFRVSLDLAQVKHGLGMQDDAIHLLRDTLRLCREKGYEYLLCRAVTTVGWMFDYLMKVERDYILGALRTSGFPYHVVEVQLLGTPRVCVDGKEILPAHWKTSKAMKTFCYLCFTKAKNLGRETLIEAVWRGVPLSQSSKRFRKAIHHVRKAFEQVTGTRDNPVIYKDETYSVADHFNIVLDTDEFMSLIECAQKCADDFSTLNTVMKKILNMYGSGFAHGWYEQWTEQVRNAYSRKMEDVLVWAADCAHRHRKFDWSILWLKHLIEMNYLEEEYHKKLWQVLAHVGRIRDMQEDFKKLKQRYKKELKMNLSDDTAELYHSLTKRS